jgi:hypothetical protein
VLVAIVDSFIPSAADTLSIKRVVTLKLHPNHPIQNCHVSLTVRNLTKVITLDDVGCIRKFLNSVPQLFINLTEHAFFLNTYRATTVGPDLKICYTSSN